MAPSETSSTKQLTAVRSVTFFILLSFTAWNLTIKRNNPIILPILTIAQLGIENMLGMVQPVTLSTLYYHLGMLVLNVPLTGAWIIYNSLWSSQISHQWASSDTPTPKAELVCRWMVVAAFFIHILIGAMQAKEEVKREQRIPTMPKEINVDIEESEKRQFLC